MPHPLLARLGFVPASSRKAASDAVLIAASALLAVALAGVVLALIFGLLGFVLALAGGHYLGHALADPEWRPLLGGLRALFALGLMATGIVKVLEIIASVRMGTPFAAANAGRIETMAWCVVALQVLALAARAAHMPIGGDINGFDVTVTPGANGLAFALVLFVLARVFRHGNAIEAEMEGTV